MMNQYNPNFYKNLEDDSAMIQAAVDAARDSGEAVTIPRFNERTGECVWDISRAIELYTGSVIYLDNCYIRQADGAIQNIFRNSNNEKPEGYTREGRQHDITIIGFGNATLDGGNYPGMNEVNYREYGYDNNYVNCMFNFINCERIKIRDINITRQRFWSMVFHYSSHIEISGIHYYAPYHWRNQDGIDLRSGCSNVLIENISGVTGDDIVAMTNLRNIYAERLADCHYDDSIHNVIVRNIHAVTRNSFVRILNHGGRKIYNVLIDGLMFDCESAPRDPRPGQFVEADSYEPLHPEIHKFTQDYGVRIGTCAYNANGPMAKYGDTYNITVRNVTCRGLVGVCLSCTAKDVIVENVRMYGGGITGVYVAQGEMKNLQLRDICCTGNPDPNNDFNDNRCWECELEGNNDKDFAALSSPQRCAVYFKDSNAENVIIRDVHIGDNMTSVIGGYGHVRGAISGVYKDDVTIPTSAAVGDVIVTEK
ncbi:MAG: hypothetical protein IJF61_05500 [Clostridia bacterium]|nr:hypothetical protein [Clostridia bacterium]